MMLRLNFFVATLQESVPLKNLFKKQQQQKSKHKSKTQNIPSQLLEQIEYNSYRFGGNFEGFITAVEIKVRKKIKICFVKNHSLHGITKSYKF